MSSAVGQILELEDRLRKADLTPDPKVFETLLDDEFVLVFDGKVSRPKEHIVDAHGPEKAQKFDRVELRDVQVIDHGASAVVTCIGDFEGAKGRFVFKFMRVWAKKPDGWKVIAGSMLSAEIGDEANYDGLLSKSARS